MSLALEIQGSSHSPSHCPSGRTDDQWLHSLMTEGRELDKVSGQPMGPMIPRVPSEFREMKENTGCYEPLMVSIGPYHHGKKELEKMEKLKAKLASQFVKDESVIAREMYHKVKELVGYARGCYAEELTHQFSNEKFTGMMFLDGYFMLRFLSNKLEKQKLRNEEVALITRDLFLLENQLPFRVLISLKRWSFGGEDQNLMGMFEDFFKPMRPIPTQRDSCRDKIYNFFSKWPKALILSSKSPRSEDISYDNVDHLLQLFYMKFIDSGRHNNRGKSWYQPTGWYRETSWNRYHTVNELKNVGIHFNPSSASKFTDVKFKKTLLGGALHVPPLNIDESTKPLLLNLAAYEACIGEYSGPLTSYVCFMRSLIDRPEDVKELRSVGILCSTIGNDDQIAKIFKEMTTNLVPSRFDFMKVRRAVESQYRSTVKRWILHYRAPISTTVVKYSFIYGFAVSAIQAYVAETKGKRGLGDCSCSNATQIHP